MKLSSLKKIPLLAALLAGALGIPAAQAAPTTFTGSYTENFDEVGTSGTTMPAGYLCMQVAAGTFTAASPITTTAIASAVPESATLAIWNAGTAVTKSSTQLYNIGCWDGTSDRALGSDATGVGCMAIQLAMTNNTGGTLYGVTFSYDCKCMTNGGAKSGYSASDLTEDTELPGYCFFYSTTGTNAAANWTEVGYAGTTNDAGGIPAAHGLCLPNCTQGTTMSSSPVNITFATPLTNGGVMYFRWADDDCTYISPDQMLAIDNISVTSYTPSTPVASITSPADNANFIPGSHIAITADASESGGTITNVEFYANGTDLGGAATAPYSLTWPNVSAGNYALTAVASDSSGILAMSSVVNVTVGYATPTVSLTSPANNAIFNTGDSITLSATASSADGTVTNVAFYQGSTLLANVTSAPYTCSWPSISAGSYTLTAQATDDHGVTGISSAVNVTVANPTVTSFTGSYTQNFDQVLTNSGTTMPPGFVSMAVAGSHSDYVATSPWTPAAVASATVDTQSLLVWNAGTAATKSGTQTYNVGCWDSLNDRALGTDPTGTAGQVIQLSMTNNTGGNLYGVVFSYDCKCLTNGSSGDESSELPGYCFFYSLTPGSTSASDWTEVGVAGDVVGGTNSAGLPIPNGLCLPNYTQGTTMSSGPVTIVFPMALTNGGVMIFRWVDDNNVASSPDQMLAIDNISITAYNPNGPMVSMTSPTNNENYIPGNELDLVAAISDLGANITNVVFYIGSTPVPLPVTVNGSNYTLSIPGVYVGNPGVFPVGSYTAYAMATDAAGLTATSATVNFTVAYVPPTVSLTSPSNGASFPAPASIPLSASAESADGTVTNVAFYQGTTLLANVASAPFNYTWTGVFAGSYNLTALATDNNGLTATSSVVSITVTNGYGTPLASITSPADNANFLPGSDIAITADASESGGTVTNVEFYANGTDLGGAGTAPYSLTWSNVSAGNYALTVVASDATGLTDTSSVVNITVSIAHVPPTVSLTSPANNAVVDVSSGLSLSATAACTDGTVTNVAFYLNGFLPIANVTSAPYNYTWTNVPTGNYTLTAVATDDSGASTTSSVVNVKATNTLAIATLQQIKTVFVICLENHDWVQSSPLSSPQQILGNPAAPYVNSLTTPGNSNAVQVSYATAYYNVGMGDHPSEPNYIWAEAGTEFGTHTDNDPSTSSGNVFSNVQHLSAQLTAAGISWRSYQEDMEFSSSEEISASGSGSFVNPYNGTTQYNYAVKHNPMAFFTDTQDKNCYPFTNFWADLASNNVARYNWITPDQYNEMHSSLPAGFTYNGTAFTGNQAAIAEGDNFLSIVVPKIMASQAYQDHGVIIIWTDETESTDDTNTTLPFIIISPLTKGNAYNSTLPYSHSSDLKTMDEIFGLAYQTNAIPTASIDAQNTGYNYADGHSAVINDLSDFFQPAAHVPPTVSLTSPANGASFAAPAMLALTATATDIDGTVTNVAFHQGTTLLGNATSAPFTFTTANLFAGSYALTAVATDNNGLCSTSSVVSVTVTNTAALNVLQSIKTIFVIAMENHDLVQKNPTGSPQQILGNPAAPYFNSLITPGNPNAAQTAWATHMFSCAINGEHPSEPNYIWQEAGTDFGIRTDNDPSASSHNVFTNVMHLSGQLSAAGIPWKTYQEDLEYTTSSLVSKSGTTTIVNPYNGTKQYNYGVKHNPMAFFNDTQNQNCYPMTNFWTDLTNNNIGRYNWITPDQYNEWHSALSGGYTYNGTAWTGDQAAIASGDNCLSIIIPKIMTSQAYKDHGVIIIWTDETESTDDTNTTLPYVIISPLCKGNAYASTLPYSHASDLKTMDEIFGLAYQTNAIPAAYYDAQNDGKYDYVDGHSAPINDLSDFFQGVGMMITNQPSNLTTNAGATASFDIGATAPTKLYYQWFFGTNMLAGQTNSTLSLASVGPTNVGSYYVVVNSANGTANSTPATLTVIYQAPNVVGGQMMLGTGGFQLNFSGPSGQTYKVLASDDLTLPRSQWTVVGSGTFNGSSVNFTDPDAVNHPNRYYVVESP